MLRLFDFLLCLIYIHRENHIWLCKSEGEVEGDLERERKKSAENLGRPTL